MADEMMLTVIFYLCSGLFVALLFSAFELWRCKKTFEHNLERLKKEHRVLTDCHSQEALAQVTELVLPIIKYSEIVALGNVLVVKHHDGKVLCVDSIILTDEQLDYIKSHKDVLSKGKALLAKLRGYALATNNIYLHRTVNPVDDTFLPLHTSLA